MLNVGQAVTTVKIFTLALICKTIAFLYCEGSFINSTWKSWGENHSLR